MATQVSQDDGKVARARKLAAQIAALSEGERLALAEKLPGVVNPQGRILSFHNTALLCQQSGRFDLTMVAGFKQWIDAGRVVQKGQHAVGMIMVPMVLKDKAGKTDPETGDVLKTTRFRFVPVFDVSQTEELQPAPIAVEVQP